MVKTLKGMEMFNRFTIDEHSFLTCNTPVITLL